jgi:membrane protein implicated in regulation of membrane protease activity
MVDFVVGANAMTAFIVIGAVGLVVVLASLVLGDIVDGLFDAFDVDFGGGIFSAPVLGSFLAAFGFGAALIMFATGTNATLGALGGLASGAVVGGLALTMMRSLINMPTDDTPTTIGLEGSTGLVITRIPAEGYGEVTIRHHGTQHKYNARAGEALASGTQVRVTGVLSASAVLVEPADDTSSTPADG